MEGGDKWLVSFPKSTIKYTQKAKRSQIKLFIKLKKKQLNLKIFNKVLFHVNLQKIFSEETNLWNPKKKKKNP